MRCTLSHQGVLSKRDHWKESKCNGKSLKLPKPTAWKHKWVECTWWAHRSSLLPFPPFLSKLFIIFPRSRSFLSTESFHFSSRVRGPFKEARQKSIVKKLNLWAGIPDGKQPKSVETSARRVERRSHHMLLRLKYSPCLLVGGTVYFYVCHSSVSVAPLHGCNMHHHNHSN